MKVIINNEVKEVKPGYFRHFLLPKKLAEIATPNKITELELKKKTREGERAKFREETLAELQRINGAEIIFEVAADEKGNLYEGISAEDIAKKFKNIKAEWISLEHPIKKAGEYEAKVKLPFGDADHLYALKLSVKARSPAL